MEVNTIIQGDCLEILRGMETASVDLIMCSPPYVDCRLYGELDFKLTGQAYVDWALERFVECYRVSRGLVAWVIEGKTKKFQWDATPALLMADLHRAGVKLRKPPIFHRVGIPGSGGPDWWRNDWEPIICATHGKLPWSDNTATGHTPKWAPGGAMSNRHVDGRRKNARDKPETVTARLNQWGHSFDSVSCAARDKDGKRNDRNPPSHRLGTVTRGSSNGDTQTVAESYDPPAKANPGNVIKCVVGGGVMGSKLAHENEAPYPESLVEPFVLSFCPPGGIVVDPFSGSGTTCAVAKRLGRKYIGIDIRESQVELSRKRIAEVQPSLLT